MKAHDCTQTHSKHPGMLWLSLPAQTCSGMLSCVHMYTAFAGLQAPMQEKLRSAVCPLFLLENSASKQSILWTAPRSGGQTTEQL